MRIVNPNFGVPTEQPKSDRTEVAKLRNGPVDWSSDAVILFSNSKANADELLRGIELKIRNQFAGKPMGYISKANSGLPAPDELYSRIAGSYTVAILGTGD